MTFNYYFLLKSIGYYWRHLCWDDPRNSFVQSHCV